MPIIGPQALKQYKRHKHPSYGNSSGMTSSGIRGQLGRGFEQLDGSQDIDPKEDNTISLSHFEAHTNDPLPKSKFGGHGRIWVRREVKITVDDAGRANHLPHAKSTTESDR